MSFPRANIKRFNEDIGCAPPPGSYDPKQKGKASGGFVDKSERFKTTKDSGAGSFNVSTVSTGSTPVKQLFAPPQPVQSGKKSKSTVPVDNAKVKELEKEIRRLMKERTDKERDLLHKEEELKKLDGNLHNAQSDRSSLQAKLAAADKELKDLKKSNDLIKSKISTVETAAKKHEDVYTEVTAIRQQLVQKDQEIARLKQEVDVAMATILSDMQMFELLTESLEENVLSYGNFVGSLNKDEDKQSVDVVSKQTKHDEDLSLKLKDVKMTVENKVKIVKKRSENLQKRFNKALHELTTLTKTMEGRYTTVVEEHSKLQEAVTQIKAELRQAIDARTSLEEQRDNLLDSNHDLQDQVKQMSTENKSIEDSYRLTQNIVELQETKAALQHQLVELEDRYSTTQKEDADRIISLEEREMIINQTTSNLHERIVELQAENEDLAATLRETGELLSKTKDENMKFEEMLINAEHKWETEKKQFLIQVEELVFEKSRAESQLSDLEETVKLLQTDILSQKSESGERIQGLTKELENEKLELSQLQNKLGDLVYEKSQLHMEIGHLEAQLKLVRCESEDMKSEADKALGLVPNLKEKVEALNNDKMVIEKRAASLSEQNSTLQRTLENFQSDFDNYSQNVEAERDEAHRKISSLMEEIDGLKEQKDQMAKELDEWLTDKSELDIEVAQLQCRVKVLEMENNQNKEEAELELRQQKEETERVKTEKEQIQTDMEQYGIDLLSNAAQIQSLRTELQSKSSERETIQSQNHSLKEELETKMDELTVSMATITEVKDLYSSKCDECEGLLEENDRLSGEMKLNRDEYEDLECRLEQTRADFLKRCDERDELVQKNDIKDSSLAILSQQVSELNKQVESVTASLQSKCEECEQLSQQHEGCEKELLSSKQQVSNYKQQIEDYKEHLQLKCDECDDLQQKYDDIDVELTLSAREIVDLHERVTSLQRYTTFLYDKLVCVTCTGYQITNHREKTTGDEEKSKLIEKYEAELAELRSKTESANNNPELEEELARYKALYDDLLAKVEPFMEQIDAFELEKQTLLGLNRNTQAEMERLGSDYAKLLGHQNQKQKIKHIVKIKDENNALKRENVALKEQVSKQKRQLQKLEDPTRRFEPAKAFRHSKENLSVTATPKSPLRDVNRK